MEGCPYSYSDYINAADMTDEEKEIHPEYKTIGGEHVVYRLEINRNNREKARLKIAVRYADEKIVI